LIRAERRDNLRAAVFRCKTPLCTPRIISGCASRKAASAWSLFPSAMAVSTFLTNVRIRPTRVRFTMVLFRVCRIRFFADALFAIDYPFLFFNGGIPKSSNLVRSLRAVNSGRPPKLVGALQFIGSGMKVSAFQRMRPCLLFDLPSRKSNGTYASRSAALRQAELQTPGLPLL